jgi:hypothetical protein
MRRYNPFFLLVGIVFLAGTGCATTKKSPCKPFRKNIDCEYLEHWQCKEELSKFGNDLIEQYNRSQIKSTHVTVNTGEGVIYNLKYRLDPDMPAIYIDATHCVKGEVLEKKRIFINLRYE